MNSIALNSIALNNGVTKEEIVEAFIQISAYTGAARAFEGYGIAVEVFGEQAARPSPSDE